MSENRETPASRAAEAPETSGTPGAPVEETEASRTEVLEAVERAKSGSAEGDDAAGAAKGEGSADAETVVAPNLVDPKAGETVAKPGEIDEAERKRREKAAETDTEMDLEVPAKPRKSAGSRIAASEELPSAAAEPGSTEALPDLDDTPARDGEIRISKDHPMAALYTQTPVPPDIRGNRGAGVLIALLATIGFAIVYAGVIALSISPQYPPSTFLEEGLLPRLMSVEFAVACAGFLVALIVLVLIVGRAGWWAYVLGGFFVAAAVWASAMLGAAMQDHFVLGERVEWDAVALVRDYGLAIPVLVAAAVGREATIWFGAWIGSRGRRVKQRNAEALAEYEQALTESQAKQR